MINFALFCILIIVFVPAFIYCAVILFHCCCTNKNKTIKDSPFIDKICEYRVEQHPFNQKFLVVVVYESGKIKYTSNDMTHSVTPTGEFFRANLFWDEEPAREIAERLSQGHTLFDGFSMKTIASFKVKHD